jgi:hypothetical protein
MTRQNLQLALLATVALSGLSATASAQNFIPQTYTYGHNETHDNAMRVLGPPAAHRGNQGLPMRDSARGARTASGASADWRGHTIFNPGARNYNYQNYYPQTYSYPSYQYQYNVAQIQQSIQQLNQAIQQVRANRQQMQYYYNQGYGYQNYRRW